MKKLLLALIAFTTTAIYGVDVITLQPTNVIKRGNAITANYSPNGLNCRLAAKATATSPDEHFLVRAWGFFNDNCQAGDSESLALVSGNGLRGHGTVSYELIDNSGTTQVSEQFQFNISKNVVQQFQAHVGLSAGVDSLGGTLQEPVWHLTAANYNGGQIIVTISGVVDDPADAGVGPASCVYIGQVNDLGPGETLKNFGAGQTRGPGRAEYTTTISIAEGAENICNGGG